MDFGKPPFFSEKINLPPMLLDRFIPPYPYGTLTDMLSYCGIKDGWILDPIGNQPTSIIELAQSGYQVFVACNNPILARILQVMCSGYNESQYKAAIADLGALRRGEERLESQIKALYNSPCPECSSIQTEVKFHWKKNQIIPYDREIECHNCGFSGVVKISDFDLETLKKIGNYNLHRNRAIQRVLPGNIEIPVAVKEVIDSYLPRSLAVISTLINKLDSMQTTADRKNIIEALLIHAFDTGNMQWGINTGRTRPRQITIPAEFYEFNLWNSLEEAVTKLRIVEKPIPITYFPQLPSEKGGICFYQGRINSIRNKNLLPFFEAIATVLPRPNQALWTYNAVWSGWLWGHQTAQKLKGALERRRYDWLWHTQAIRTVFDFASKLKIPFIATAPELTNSYILAYLSAASSSNFHLQNAAYHSELKTGQFYWFQNTSKPPSIPIINDSKNLSDFLTLKSEPANYQELLSIYLISKTIDESEIFKTNLTDNTLLMQTQKKFEKNLLNSDLFIQVDQDQLENADFWLTNPPNAYQPISDQIEGLFIRFIQKKTNFSGEEINYSINQNLPGVLPASPLFIQRLLNSYCQLVPNQLNYWMLSPQEYFSERKNDLQLMVKLIHKIGSKIGYQITGTNPIQWISNESRTNFQFFLTASSIISQFPFSPTKKNVDTVIIFPGSRAELISYKLKNDLVYSQHYGKFHFVKFRHLRTINDNPGLNYKTWVQILDSDPAVWHESNQPVLF